MNDSSPVTVAAALIRDGDNLLLTKRLEDTHLGGLWEFPGGKVEEGESLEDALMREIHEELGIEIKIGPLYLTQVHQYPDRLVHLHFFECRILEGTPVCRKAAGFIWISPEEMVQLEIPEANRPLVEKLKAG